MSVSYLMMIICKLEENDDIEGDILKICSLFKFRVLCHLCKISSMSISDILYKEVGEAVLSNYFSMLCKYAIFNISIEI